MSSEANQVTDSQGKRPFYVATNATTQELPAPLKLPGIVNGSSTPSPVPFTLPTKHPQLRYGPGTTFTNSVPHAVPVSPTSNVFHPFANRFPAVPMPINSQFPHMTFPQLNNLPTFWPGLPYNSGMRQINGYPAPFIGMNPGFPMGQPVLPTARPVAQAVGPRATITPITETQKFIQEQQEVKSEDEKEEEGSLRALPDEEKSKRIITGSAYRRRNVYKSIIRHMFSYVRKNRGDITNVLRCAGFSMQEIEHAFCKVNLYNDEERKKGSRKRSQNIVKNMVIETSIYTYILCETLYALSLRWEEGKLGKIARKNAGIYKEVCKKYYDECIRMLGRGAQGKSHLL